MPCTLMGGPSLMGTWHFEGRRIGALPCTYQGLKIHCIYLWGVRQGAQGISSTDACLRPQKVFCVESEAELQELLQGLPRLQGAGVYHLRPVLHQAVGRASHTPGQRNPAEHTALYWVAEALITRYSCVQPNKVPSSVSLPCEKGEPVHLSQDNVFRYG